MDSEVWAIVGVVVGAILGGGAQILNAWLQASRERKRTVRETRRIAYTTFLAEVDPLFLDYPFLLHEMDQAVAGGERPSGEVPERLGVDSARAVALSGGLELIAPVDTAAAARTLVHAWSANVGASLAAIRDRTGFDPARHSIQAERSAFISLARRDLGLSSSDVLDPPAP